MSKKCLSFLVLLAFNLRPDAALAEHVTAAWFETTDLPDNETHRGVIYFAQQMMRVDPDRKSDLHASVIFRGDREHMIVLDHTQKTYFILDDRLISLMGGKLDAAMARLEAHLAQLPEGQREIARRMMQKRMLKPPSSHQDQKTLARVEVRPRSREINGYSCRLFELFRGKAKVSSIWATREVDYRQLTSVFRELNAFSRRLRENARFAHIETGIDFLGFEGLEGFPILVETYDNGILVQKTIFTKVAPMASPVSFEADQTYKSQPPRGPKLIATMKGN